MPFEKWRARLAGEKVKTFTQPDQDDEGYYRVPKREKQKNAAGQPNGQTKIVGWTPVAYFLDDGLLCGVVGDRDMTGNEVIDYWTYCCAFPISYETYIAVLAGQPWPDLPGNAAAPPPVADTPVEQAVAVPADERAAAIANGELRSDNMPAEEEVLPLDVQHANGIATAIGAAPTTVSTEAEAGVALGSSNRIRELRLAAEKAAKGIVEPLRAVYEGERNKWLPIVQNAKAAEDKIAKVILTFRDAERKRIAAEQLAERQKAIKAENERLAAQKLIDEANARNADRAIAAGVPEPEPTPPLPEPVRAAPVVAPAPVAPSYGNRTIKEVEKTFLESITDQDAVYTFFKNNPKVIALLTDLATATVKTGIEVPGTTTRKGLV